MSWTVWHAEYCWNLPSPIIPIWVYSGNPPIIGEMPKSKFTKADDLFRNLLKRERTSKRLTQAALAARLGQPQSYVSKYELGERRLDLVETKLLCDALEIDFVEFAAKFSSELKKTR